MSTLNGDIVEICETLAKTTPIVLIHGCNCFHTMGAGVAKCIKKKWPQVLEADKAFAKKGDVTKLGSVSYATIHPNLVVANAYTQFSYGRHTSKPYLDYDAIRSCFQSIVSEYGETHTLVYPRIGAGLAGGDWTKIHAIIREECTSCKHIEVVYK